MGRNVGPVLVTYFYFTAFSKGKSNESKNNLPTSSLTYHQVLLSLLGG